SRSCGCRLHVRAPAPARGGRGARRRLCTRRRRLSRAAAALRVARLPTRGPDDDLPRRRVDGRLEGGERTLDVLVARLPVRDGDANRAPPFPGGAAQPGLAALLDAAKDVVRVLVRLAAEQDLVQHELVAAL